ncbi:Lrp/AsnC family transcriptional regulator [Brachymonas denitrificans]|uniref:Lrp/AsnC family transcriptional regulator n=1 Tax=Brachymonas denitrificans TaxID=28220 RepID=UPI001BCDC34C|nr:Lrp/AsnC family transcriptional regulator [Brachymonas denitrificans]
MNEYDVGGVELDAADWRLLEQLQQDASLTNQALAERCHISPPTCLRRVRRLQALGFIERTVSILGGDALRALTGAGLTAIVEVTLDVQAEEEQQQFEQLAVAEPAIQQCYRTSPGPDFILIATVADMPAFMALSQRLFTRNANVRNVRSFFSVKRAKFSTRIPFPERIARS